MVNYWNRLVKMDDNRLTKRVFKYDHERNRSNWSYDMKKLFLMLNMDDVFDNITVCNLLTAQNELAHLNNMHWFEEVLNRPKLRTYILFKNEVDVEPYVKQHMHKRIRSRFAQFRFGILPLHIETGRYENTPVFDRKCKLCELDHIEDEYHFLMICPFYNDFRLTMFYKASQIVSSFATCNNDDKFVILVKTCQKYVAQFIDSSFEKRRNFIYKNL